MGIDVSGSAEVSVSANVSADVSASASAGVSADASASLSASASASVSASLSASASVGASASAGGGRFEPTPACRFYVRVEGIQQAIFTEVSGLSQELDVRQVIEGGNNTGAMQLPGRIKTGKITLKRGLTRSNDFLMWLQRIGAGQVERKDISVILYDVSGQVLLQWDLFSAFPSRWSCSGFQAGSAEVAMETVDIHFNTMQMNGAGGQLSASASLSASAGISL